MCEVVELHGEMYSGIGCQGIIGLYLSFNDSINQWFKPRFFSVRIKDGVNGRVKDPVIIIIVKVPLIIILEKNSNDDLVMTPQNGTGVMFEETENSTELMDGLRGLIPKTEVIIDLFLSIDVFEFVFSMHSNVMMWLRGDTHRSTITACTVRERL